MLHPLSTFRASLSAPVIAFPFAIPTMVMFKRRTAGRLPITGVILPPVVMWSNPHGAGIGGTAPIALVPPIPPAGWIPVAFHKNVLWPGVWRPNHHDPGR